MLCADVPCENAYASEIRHELSVLLPTISAANRFSMRWLDVHFVSPAPVPSSWERRAPARLQKPRWSVAIPETTLEKG